MKRFLPFLFLLIISCKSNIEKEKLENKIDLRGKTFVLNPENGKGTLTVQFMDSTCNMFELNEYNLPWRLVNFENSHILILGHLTIPLHKENDSTIIGLNIGERDTKLRLEEKLPKWNLDKILGKWTEEFWNGVDKSNLPPPPPRIDDSEVFAPPFYEVSNNQLKHYFFGIDSAKILIDSSLEHIMVNNLNDDRLGYQKKWRILSVSDSTMTVERKFSRHYPDSPYYFDGTDTLKLVKKR